MRKHYYVKFNHTPLRTVHRYIIELFLSSTPALAAGIIAIILRNSSPQAVDRIYSSGIYNSISSFLGFFARLTRHSITSYIYILLSAAAAVLVLSFIFFIIKSPDRLFIAGLYLKIVVFVVSIIFFLFSILCMPNYYRLTFAQKASIELTDYTVNDLEKMCMHIIEQTNIERQNVPDDLTVEYNELADTAKKAFDALNEEYPFIGRSTAVPKPFVFSEVLTILNLTGFYFPYTNEANVNVHMPPIELPFTMCHELSHTRGFMRENEANYIGFAACMRSDDAFVRYSGLYCALMHSMNSLYAEDSERYFELRKLYSRAVSEDVAALNRFWQPYFDTPAAELSNSVNDAYLKANDLSDGIKSYGRMVDLLMAQYLKHGTLV